MATSAPTGLEWAGVALLGLGTFTLAGCLPAIFCLWRAYRIHVRPVPPMYYRVAGRAPRMGRVRLKS